MRLKAGSILHARAPSAVACLARGLVAWGTLVAATVLGAGPSLARAQLPVVVAWLPEFHVDVSPFTGAQVAIGASQATSFYSRVGALVAAGARQDGPGVRGMVRVEVHARVSADPIQELRWAPYAVGGAMLSCADARRCRPLLLVRLGVEGPMRSGWIPGVELGLGDGAQLGFVLRAGRAGRR